MKGQLTLDRLRARFEERESVEDVLDELQCARPGEPSQRGPFLGRIARGIGFIAEAFDPGGVTMEIARQGAALESLLVDEGYEPVIHCIGGGIGGWADGVLEPAWRRKVLTPGVVPSAEVSARSDVRDTWRRALELCEELTAYVLEEELGLLIPANVNSNPGDPALSLAVVLTSELTDCPVLSSNHDFYWEREGDAALEPREPCLRRLLPWNGRRWIQVNANPLQPQHLVETDGIPADRVFSIATGVKSPFFEEVEPERKLDDRRIMTRILAGGTQELIPDSLGRFYARLEGWIEHPHPIALGCETDLTLDLARTESLHLLQPTRVAGQKRVERDWELIGALLDHPPFRAAFTARADLTLTLHVTGPVAPQHRADLERVLDAYRRVLDDLPRDLARRLFMAFSVGHQGHPSQERELRVADVYRLADLVLLPSRTETRGLPIPESAAAGIPIVCSRYAPPEAFAETIGESLPAAARILVDEFPEGEFTSALLDRVSDILLDPERSAEHIRHNRAAAHARYTLVGLQGTLWACLERLGALDEGV